MVCVGVLEEAHIDDELTYIMNKQERWKEMVKGGHLCCMTPYSREAFGDYMLMKALEEKGIPLSGRRPMFQGERPATIPYGPGPNTGGLQWCEPIITMHRVTASDVNAIWQFERQRSDVTVGFVLLQGVSITNQSSIEARPLPRTLRPLHGP
jgi:hypothetical protein